MEIPRVAKAEVVIVDGVDLAPVDEVAEADDFLDQVDQSMFLNI